ncbi:hypothetical protein [Kriegella aquimaris]|uniref:Uncharacterized protein n=1 Tax=Kriegella aquimaris TaxID=192904 RepID=A0A1G9T5M0_9FLAO|nr:hypothetical protein [Kriegella aquimaris]SDM42405.1 hypothetical protein SAMN04488514_108211 [Kriegella aquimaris]
MHIEIELKTNKEDSSITCFPIMLKGLEEAMNDTYLDLGTPYRPIAIDNFVNIEKNEFPEITEKTTISISLKPADDGPSFGLSNPELVCCKAKNVGKDFINQDGKLEDHWKKIFNYKKKWVQNTPDGTLYISPNKKHKCVIKTKEALKRNYISYSIMFSMLFENSKGEKRKYYFNLDPLVKISSRG